MRLEYRGSTFADAAASRVLHLELFDFVILFFSDIACLFPTGCLCFLDLAPSVEADMSMCDLIFSGQQVQRTWSDFDGALLQGASGSSIDMIDQQRLKMRFVINSLLRDTVLGFGQMISLP